jgi:hypothetical protein
VKDSRFHLLVFGGVKVIIRLITKSSYQSIYGKVEAGQESILIISAQIKKHLVI